jgi:hypothetical protein
MIEDSAPGVKSKANAKFTERIAKLSDRRSLVKELSHGIARIQERYRALCLA